MSSIQNQLLEIIKPHLPPKALIEESALLFSTGILDSLSLLDIVQAIENHWAFSTHWTELNLDNFDSLQRMTNYVAQKTNDD
jgi:acyl carrier protein